MIVFERVTSLQIIRSFYKKWVFVAMFLLLFIVTANTHSVYAVDADCEPNLIEGLRTKCLPFADPATGQILPGTEYYKCADNIQCDLDVNNHNTRRCCVEPTSGIYGGDCLNPGAIDRKDLGTDGGGANWFNFKPKSCNVDEDAVSPSGKKVFITTTKLDLNGDVVERSLLDMFEDGETPQQGNSSSGLPLVEELQTLVLHPGRNNEKRVSLTWIYALRSNGTREYFAKDDFLKDTRYNYYVVTSRNREIHFNEHPSDPREPVGGVIKNLGCKIGNAFVTPLYNGIASITRLVTNQNNLPDITLLCKAGTPQFLDPAALTFEPTGGISGLDPTKCKCVDSNSGPGTAAVLLCTRFIAGIEDGTTGGAQWRALLPQPDPTTHIGRFSGLLFGALKDADTIDQFRQGVKSEIDGFFNSNEVRQWADYLVQISSNVYIPEIFLVRFFGVHSMPTPNPPLLTATELDTFKKNPFVRQYIGCLSCALYGGFPSALGCMPMDKVERFLAEGVLGVGITFAGAFAVLCIIYGAIQFQLSGGESAKVQKAQKLITQCVVGLLIIIFSVFLLRFVGVNLLQIYGLG